MSSRSHLHLPLEIILLIADHLSFADRMSVATTSRELQALLARDIFSTLRFTNQEADRESIQAVLAQYGHFVRSLYFECCLRNGSEYIGASFTENKWCLTSKVLPKWTCDLLSGRSMNRSRKITIKFVQGDKSSLGPEWDTVHECELSWSTTTYYSTLPSMPDQVFDALSNNIFVRDLEIESLLPHRACVDSAARWRVFLQQLRSFSLRLWSPDYNLSVSRSCVHNYLCFQRRLDKHVLSYATNLTHLQLKADRRLWCRKRSERTTAIWFEKQSLPNLKRLELQSCVVDKALARFLFSHTRSLHCLILRDCTRCIVDDDGSDNFVAWDFLFHGIRSKNPVLWRMEIANGKVTYDIEEKIAFLEDENDQRAELIKATQKRFAFPGCSNHSELVFDHSSPPECKRWATEEDVSEYIALMLVVLRNAKAAAEHQATDIERL